MAMIAAKCTNCGANIQVDKTKEAGICESCGTAFITEKVINNYNTTVTNNFNGATINIEGHNLDNLLKMANLSWESKDYKAALDSCDKALMIDFENYTAWEIKAKSFGWIDSTLKTPKCQEALSMARKAISFAPMEEIQRISDELQTEICLQTLGLIEIYSQMNSLGQVMHRPMFAFLMSTYLEALEFAYVTPNTLKANCMLIISKLSTGNSYQEFLFSDNIKGVQNEFNHGKNYIDDVRERQSHGLIENEINYWRDYPQSITEKKDELLSTYENELELWNKINEQYTELATEHKKVIAIIKQNQFNLFGDGAKLRKENKVKLQLIESEIRKIEYEYSQRKGTYKTIERKLEILKSI